jgi:hypothetical protein
MTQADRVLSTPPTDAPAPRPLTPQERADELLMRWRLARTAGIPTDRRLDREDRR